MLNIISLGAGVQSSTMALMAAEGEITPMPDCAIFADTQWEQKVLYDYLDYLEPLLPFPVHRVTAGDLTQDLRALPLFGDGGKMLFRECTGRYKIQPIIKKEREMLGLKPKQHGPKEVAITQWIGISMDECTRMKPADHRWIEHRWPLIEKRMNRMDCLKWMADNGFKKPGKSACVGCPYRDDESWREIKMNDPEEFARAVEIDKAVRGGVKGAMNNELYLHNSLTPLDEIDFRNLEDRGQLNLFENECTGICGM